MRAVIKYPGAKWNLADWIISHFPPHRSYLEPFFGSGAVLFSKSRSAIETINDRDNDVINLFEWIRKDPERLAQTIYWTPYAREVYNRAWEAQHTETDSFQRAVDFYARMMMGHGFLTTGGKVGWKNDVQGREAALELITRFNYPNVLIYADPPYLLQTRHGKQYRHEMTDADHRDLLDALKAHKGPVLLSGYESQLYNNALKSWYQDEAVAYTQTAKKRREILWMNFEPFGQKSLF